MGSYYSWIFQENIFFIICKEYTDIPLTLKFGVFLAN